MPKLRDFRKCSDKELIHIAKSFKILNPKKYSKAFLFHRYVEILLIKQQLKIRYKILKSSQADIQKEVNEALKNFAKQRIIVQKSRKSLKNGLRDIVLLGVYRELFLKALKKRHHLEQNLTLLSLSIKITLYKKKLLSCFISKKSSFASMEFRREIKKSIHNERKRLDQLQSEIIDLEKSLLARGGHSNHLSTQKALLRHKRANLSLSIDFLNEMIDLYGLSSVSLHNLDHRCLLSEFNELIADMHIMSSLTKKQKVSLESFFKKYILEKREKFKKEMSYVEWFFIRNEVKKLYCDTITLFEIFKNDLGKANFQNKIDDLSRLLIDIILVGQNKNYYVNEDFRFDHPGFIEFWGELYQSKKIERKQVNEAIDAIHEFIEHYDNLDRRIYSILRQLKARVFRGYLRGKRFNLAKKIVFLDQEFEAAEYCFKKAKKLDDKGRLSIENSPLKSSGTQNSNSKTVTGDNVKPTSSSNEEVLIYDPKVNRVRPLKERGNPWITIEEEKLSEKEVIKRGLKKIYETHILNGSEDCFILITEPAKGVVKIPHHYVMTTSKKYHLYIEAKIYWTGRYKKLLTKELIVKPLKEAEQITKSPQKNLSNTKGGLTFKDIIDFIKEALPFIAGGLALGGQGNNFKKTISPHRLIKKVPKTSSHQMKRVPKVTAHQMKKIAKTPVHKMKKAPKIPAENIKYRGHGPTPKGFGKAFYKRKNLERYSRGNIPLGIGGASQDVYQKN